tara:strand:+ start:350 stop:673 length:324 start_codon:yes stop_codon:yes gene_type:complete
MPIELKKEEPQQMDDTGKEYYGRGPAPRKAAPSAEKADDGVKAVEKQNKIEKERKRQITNDMETVPRKKSHRDAADSGRVITPGMRNFLKTLREKETLSDTKIRMRP